MWTYWQLRVWYNIRLFNGKKYNDVENIYKFKPVSWEQRVWYPAVIDLCTNENPSLLTWVQTDIQQLILTGHCIKNKLKVKSLDITSHFIIEDLCLLRTSPLQNTSIYGENENKTPPAFKLSQRTSFPLSSIRVCSVYRTGVVRHQHGGQRWGLRGQMGLVVLL